MNKHTSTLTNIGSDITSTLQLQKEVTKIAVDSEKRIRDLSAKLAFITEQALSECPVCYCPTSVKNSCCMPTCGHNMCVTCYYKWVGGKGKNSCPMCRADIFSRDSKLRGTLSRLNGESQESLQILRGSLQHYRNKINDKIEELALLKDTVAHVKYDLDWSSRELRIIETELADREDILDEMVLYKRDINKWKKKHDKRIKREISLGYKNWRKCIGKVNVLAKEKVAIRIIVNSSNLIKWHDSITPFMKLELGCLRTINTNIIKNNLKIDTDEEEIGWGGTIFADLNDIY